jgi:hypothetical protein
MTTAITTTSTTVTVDIAALLSTAGHVAQHPATGILHALGATVPVDALVDPLGLTIFRSNRTKITSGLSRYTAMGLKIVAVLSDDWNYSGGVFPGDSGFTISQWEDWVDNFCGQLDTAGITPYAVDIWNEPDLAQFWPRSFAQFCQVWHAAWGRIRIHNPTWKICGPSISGWNQTWWSDFFADVYSRGGLYYPDLVSFHQTALPQIGLQEPWTFPDSLAAMKVINASYGVGATPFFLGEYNPGEINIVRPGVPASWLISMDAAGFGAVMGACHSSFPESDYADVLLNTGDGVDNSTRDTLDGILAPNQMPRAIWFMYRDYLLMTGRQDSDLSAAVLVSADATKKEVRVLYTARTPSTTRQLLTLTGVGTAFGRPQVFYNVQKYPDIAWAQCSVPPITDYGSLSTGLDSITLRIPAAAAGTEAISFTFQAR